MESKYYWQYWKCECGTKNRGDKNECSNCFSKLPPNVKWIDSNELIVDHDEIERAKVGAYWTCVSCGKVNENDVDICVECHTDRREYKNNQIVHNSDELSNEQKKYTMDYIENPKEEKNIIEKINYFDKYSESFKEYIYYIGIGILVLLLAYGIYFLLKPTYIDSTVIDKEWQTNVQILDYIPENESGWTLPVGENIQLQKTELGIYGYEDVLDHYEPIQVPKTKIVVEGTKRVSYTDKENCGTTTSYERKQTSTRKDCKTVSIGNGRSRQDCTDVPVYSDVPVSKTKYCDVVKYKDVPNEKTVTYYVTEQKPVYRKEPIIKTYYYYIEWEWETVKNNILKGKNLPIQYDETKMDEQKIGDKTVRYQIKTKEDVFYVDENQFKKYNINDKIVLKKTLGLYTIKE